MRAVFECFGCLVKSRKICLYARLLQRCICFPFFIPLFILRWSISLSLSCSAVVRPRSYSSVGNYFALFFPCTNETVTFNRLVVFHPFSALTRFHTFVYFWVLHFGWFFVCTITRQFMSICFSP